MTKVEKSEPLEVKEIWLRCGTLSRSYLSVLQKIQKTQSSAHITESNTGFLWNQNFTEVENFLSNTRDLPFIGSHSLYRLIMLKLSHHRTQSSQSTYKASISTKRNFLCGRQYCLLFNETLFNHFWNKTIYILVEYLIL